MEIGKLDKRIILQKFTSIINDNGFEIQEWADYTTVWASVSNLHGREFFSAMQVQAEKTIKFTIRYCEDIDTTMKILFEGKLYDVTFIDDIKYSHKFMEIQAMAVI